MRFQGHQGHCVAVVTHKLYFTGLALAMNEHQGPEITAHEATSGQIAGQRHGIEFIERFHGFLGRGGAVIKRGSCVP